MAENAPAVASAVVIPESEEPISPGNKRRRSSSPDPSIKRARTAEDQNGSVNNEQIPTSNGAAEDSTAAPEAEPRKPISRDDERKRGKRLFGGMLGILSGGQGQQRKRRPVDAAQQETMRREAKQQSEEVRKREYAELMDARKKEQVTYNEQALRRKYATMRASARFLKTQTEPHIYYLPRRLSKEQDNLIHEQIARVNEEIEQERKQLGLNGTTATEAVDSERATLSTAVREEENQSVQPDSSTEKANSQRDTDAPETVTPAPPPTPPQQPPIQTAAEQTNELRHPEEDDEYKDDHEDEAEVNGEDTVIY